MKKKRSCLFENSIKCNYSLFDSKGLVDLAYAKTNFFFFILNGNFLPNTFFSNKLLESLNQKIDIFLLHAHESGTERPVIMVPKGSYFPFRKIVAETELFELAGKLQKYGKGKDADSDVTLLLYEYINQKTCSRQHFIFFLLSFKENKAQCFM